MIERTQKQIMERWPAGADPVVSVICTAYNHAPYIGDALDSFLMQETDFPFEVLVHDDASPDGTADIIRAYEKKYPGIIKAIYQTENQYSKGVNITDSILVPLVKGVYIAFCEGDDRWCDEKKLQKQYDYMSAHEICTLCVHNTIFHDLRGVEPDRLFFPWQGIYKLADIDVFFGWNVHTSSYFMRTELYERLPFRGSKFFFGDFILLTSAYMYGEVVALPDTMSVYNAHVATGVTASNYGSAEHRRKVAQWRIDYLEAFNEASAHRFDGAIRARIGQERFDTVKTRGEYLAAAKAFGYSPYFKSILRKMPLLPRLKAYWKYRGHPLGGLWYLSLRFRKT